MTDEVNNSWFRNAAINQNALITRLMPPLSIISHENLSLLPKLSASRKICNLLDCGTTTTINSTGYFTPKQAARVESLIINRNHHTSSLKVDMVSVSSISAGERSSEDDECSEVSVQELIDRGNPTVSSSKRFVPYSSDEAGSEIDLHERNCTELHIRKKFKVEINKQGCSAMSLPERVGKLIWQMFSPQNGSGIDSDDEVEIYQLSDGNSQKHKL